MSLAAFHSPARSHEQAFVIRGVVVRLFTRDDETSWVSAASLSLLAGCTVQELLAGLESQDVSSENVAPEAPAAAALYSGVLPVVNLLAYLYLVDTLPALSAIADELAPEVFGALHHKVLALRRERAMAVAASAA